MDDVNPYARPRTEVAAARRLDDLEVQDDRIVGDSPMILPDDLCVRCAAVGTSGKTYDRKLGWVPFWLTLIAFLGCFSGGIGFLLATVLYFFVRKSLEIEYHLCTDCSERRGMVVIGIVAAGLVAAAAIFGIMTHPARFFLAFSALMIATLFVSRFVNHPLRLSYRRKRHHLRGCSEQFLEALPDAIARHRERDPFQKE